MEVSILIYKEIIPICINMNIFYHRIIEEFELEGT